MGASIIDFVAKILRKDILVAEILVDIVQWCYIIIADRRDQSWPD